MLGSTLALWAIKSLVPGLPPLAWMSIWKTNWLVIVASFVPHLPQHILQTGQTVGRRFFFFFGWVGVSIFIARSLLYGHPHIFVGISIVLYFYLAPEMLPSPSL